MFAKERYVKILNILSKNGSVTVSELCEQFGVSIETVRRDLEYLENENVLTRVHGGAMSKKKMIAVSDFAHRSIENIELKRQLCKTAMGYINEGESIAIMPGTTAVIFSEELKERFNNLTVITNSPDVFNELRDVSDFKIILIGGEYYPKERAFVGNMAADLFKQYHVSKTIVIPISVSLKYGLTTYISELIPTDKVLFEICDETIILADSTKFETVSTYKLTDLKPYTTIITDKSLSDEIYKNYKEHNINIIK